MRKLDVAELDELFLEAAETERKMPAALRKQRMSAWPDHVKEWSAYGYGAFQAPVLKATPDQITRYDHALDLVCTRLEQDERRIVWAVAVSACFRSRGPRWSTLARILGLNDPRIVKRRYKDVLIKLYYRQ